MLRFQGWYNDFCLFVLPTGFLVVEYEKNRRMGLGNIFASGPVQLKKVSPTVKTVQRVNVVASPLRSTNATKSAVIAPSANQVRPISTPQQPKTQSTIQMQQQKNPPVPITQQKIQTPQIQQPQSKAQPATIQPAQPKVYTTPQTQIPTISNEQKPRSGSKSAPHVAVEKNVEVIQGAQILDFSKPRSNSKTGQSQTEEIKPTPKPVEEMKPQPTPKPIETPKPVEEMKPQPTPKPIETPKPVEEIKPTPKPIETTKPVEEMKPQSTPKPIETPKPVEEIKPTPKPIVEPIQIPKARSDYKSDQSQKSIEEMKPQPTPKTQNQPIEETKYMQTQKLVETSEPIQTPFGAISPTTSAPGEHEECSSCKKILDGNYFILGEAALCSSCFTTNCRCSKCSKTIEEDYVSSNEKYYHPDCLALTCGHCNSKIKVNDISIEVFGRHLHADCFKCHNCKTKLVNQNLEAHFLESEGKAFCERCAMELEENEQREMEKNSPPCQNCQKAVLKAQSHVELGNRTWHSDCFKCATCKNSNIEKIQFMTTDFFKQTQHLRQPKAW